ncbi:MAG: ATP-binding protein [Turicibacter sp.]|nr:ATP-binding protein [Turicibacter sp.]
MLHNSLDKFVATEDWQKGLKTLAQDYLDNFNSVWFIVLGQSGSGKTMVCSSICNQLLLDYKQVRYMSWAPFCDTTKREKDAQKRDDCYQKNAQAEVLYIDDLLKGMANAWDVQNAWQLINDRYKARLPTIISSELLIKDLILLDEALAGRLLERAGKYYFPIQREQSRNFRLRGIG